MIIEPNDTGGEEPQFEADTSVPSTKSLENLIRKRAYEIFDERGREPGHELDDWRQAEREIKHHLAG